MQIILEDKEQRKAQYVFFKGLGYMKSSKCKQHAKTTHEWSTVTFCLIKKCSLLRKYFFQNLIHRTVLAVLFYMAYLMIGTNFTGIELVHF